MIKEIAYPNLKDPIFIAAWPGMGEVAYRSATFIKEALSCKVFAKLEARHFFRPAAVTVSKGIIDLPAIPAGLFYYHKSKNNRDMIIFLGEIQPSLEHAEDLSVVVIDFVKKYKAKKMLTFAAKPEPIDHKSSSCAWLAGTHKEFLKEFDKFKTKKLEEGQISGLNGIILGVAKKKGIKGICFLGEIPFYTVQIENPKANLEILQIINKYLDLDMDFSSLVKRSKFIEEEIDKLIAYLKGEMQAPPEGPMPLSEEDIEKIKKDLAAYTKLPQSAREKIEDLFLKAKKDITVANTLKKELDNWNVYKEYEDKFLDLFKKSDKKNNIQ